MKRYDLKLDAATLYNPFILELSNRRDLKSDMILFLSCQINRDLRLWIIRNTILIAKVGLSFQGHDQLLAIKIDKYGCHQKRSNP
jgi:hypothetical protein